MKKKQYVIVRTYSAGCFAGYFESEKGQEVVLTQARRLWQWSGAASLSQLAVSGTSNPSGCKFPAATPRHKLYQAIETIEATEAARKSIEAIPEWKV